MVSKSKRGVGVVAAVATMAFASAGCASADQDVEAMESSENGLFSSNKPSPPFYTNPVSMPANDGDLIRSEPMKLSLDPKGLGKVALTSTGILYRSTRRDGTPIAVSGSVLVPKTKWVGKGTRPVIGYAVGTQGIGDSCAPSRLMSEGFEYEAVFMSGLLARGYALAITDYEGLGTPGVHTYMDRLSQGHAVLDVVRAAEQLDGTGLTSESPVAFFGYSQGGGAAASAAELASTYAPELKIKGTVAGAVPADLTVLPKKIDGTIWAEFLWYAIAGVSASYGYDIEPYLNATGLEFYKNVSDDCVFDLCNSALKKSKEYTVDGRSLAEIIKDEPFRTMLDEQRIGRLKPNAPVLVTHSLLDDTIPFSVGQQLTRDWCALGAKVRFSPNVTPLHLGAMVNNGVEVYAFLEARFADAPVFLSCN